MKRCSFLVSVIVFASACRPDTGRSPNAAAPPSQPAQFAQPPPPGLATTPQPSPPPPIPQPEASSPPPELDEAPGTGAVDERFTGKITAVTFGCEIDAGCEVVVDRTKHVDFGHDTRGQPPSPWGKADAVWALKSTPGSGVGRTVEVFAATLDHQYYTLRGKSTYYIHVLNR